MNTKITFDETSAALMSEIADLYYNQGMTQQEIARQYDCNRFKIAKMIQNARDEGIVEITIHKPNKRHSALEQALTETFQLSKAIVLDTRDLSRAEALSEIGKTGAMYLEQILSPSATIGVTWGKTIRSVATALDPKTQNPINVVQLCGCFRHINSSDGSRNITHTLAMKFNGEYFYMNIPIYINDEQARNAMLREPLIEHTLNVSRKMDAVLTGIGSRSSLPFNNPVLKSYIAEEDWNEEPNCIGSIYGYVLDRDGRIANISLNRKIVATSLQDILTTPHKLAIATGRHKVDIIIACMKNRYINELITDRATAEQILSTANSDQ
ncbi:sugar-binding transcriptional regulator [Brotaphodocola sp.]|uniref:sugar-binding transcriptional regulator n=1 Tax=Brotaphodocola sp. TaxID=3073577 RepID=UPI003D7E37FC